MAITLPLIGIDSGIYGTSSNVGYKPTYNW